MSQGWAVDKMDGSTNSAKSRLQFGELSPGLLQNGNLCIGVFPEDKENLIGGLGFGGVTLEGVGASETELRKFPDDRQRRDTSMVQHGFELGGSLAAFSQVKVGHDAKEVGEEGGVGAEFVGLGGLQAGQRLFCLPVC